jgi:hypothetical protein
MSRELTSTIQAACAAQQVIPAYLVELIFDSAPLRMWGGRGNLTWWGRTFTGTGDFGGISAISETAKIEANGIDLSLSGIPSQMISLALAEPYRGRRVYVWLAFFSTTTGALLADPVPVFAGRMDTMRISDSGQTSTISVSCESKLIDLERARERRYTHEDQQDLYPGDLGLEYVASLQEKELFWGRVQK